MRQHHSAPISEHRLARFVLWLGVVLASFACGALWRRQRYAGVNFGTVRKAVRNIVLLHAAQLLPSRAPRACRDFARPGFRRRGDRCTLRAAGGFWLRRQLRAQGGFITQVKHLAEALRRYRALGAAIARRRRFGLSRLRPILVVAPPADRVVSLHGPAPHAADSS